MNRLVRHLVMIAASQALALPAGLAAQGPEHPERPAVLFICEHGTIKSLLAKELFEQYASAVGLRMEAWSRGTAADSVVPPWMRAALGHDKFDIETFKPRPLSSEDLVAAAFVVSFDVPASASAGAHAPREQWDGLPSVSADYPAGRDAIKARVHHLVDSLRRVQKTRQS